MRRMFLIVCQLVLSAIAITPVIADTPRSDAEIRQCISERLTNSPGLKDQKFTVEVSGGVATLSGVAANPGKKGGATQVAKKCKASSVTNNITISPEFKSAKKKM